MLPTHILKRRIAAARTLRGLTQEDLQEALVEEGFGRREFGRVERGELPLNNQRRRTIASALGVPEAWLSSESVDEIVGLDYTWKPTPAIARKLAALERAVIEAAQGLHQGTAQGETATGGPDPSDA